MDELFALQSLPAVPMLDIDGENWPVFKARFQDHLEGLGLDAHFDVQDYPPGSYEEIEAKPIKKDAESDDDFKKRLAEWKEGENKWTERQRAWKRNDAQAVVALGMVIPDSLYMEISERKRFCEKWKAVEARIEQTNLRHKSNLKKRLNQMYCTDRGNVIAHLEDMEEIYQQLASRNAKISDEDYVDAIIRSLPRSYSSLMTPLLTIYSETNRPITPAAIKDAVWRVHEARQRATRNNRSNETAPHTDTRGRATRKGRGRGQGGNRGERGNHRRGGRANEDRDQSGLTCFNCGGKGHKAAACPSQKKPREDKRGGRKGSGETRDREAAAIADNDNEEAWMAMAMSANEIAESAVHGTSYNPVQT